MMRCAIACAVAAAAPWAAPQPGRPPHRIDALTANGLIRRRLAEVFNGRRRPFLVARLSLGAELSVAAEYADGRREDFAARPLLASHAGVHGPDEEASVFAREYASALNASAVVAGFGGDAEARVARALAPRAAFVEHRAVEPFYFGDEAWTAALRGRRVLICVEIKILRHGRRRVGDVVGLGVVTYFLPNVPLFMHLSDPNVPKLIILLKRTGRVRSSLQRLDEHRALYKKKIKWLYLNKN